MAKTDPHSVMLQNLRRLVGQAEEADRSGDTVLANGLWRAAQSHAKQISPFDPDTAVPILERIMCRFSSLAEAASDQRLAAGYYRAAQGAATDLAPLRLTRVKADTDEAEDPEDIARRQEGKRQRVEKLMAEAEVVPLNQRCALWDKCFAEFDSRSLQKGG